MTEASPVIIIDLDPDEHRWAVYRRASVFIDQNRIDYFITVHGYEKVKSLSEGLWYVKTAKEEKILEDLPVLVFKPEDDTRKFDDDNSIWINSEADEVMALLRFA